MASRHALDCTNTGRSALFLKDIILKAAMSNRGLHGAGPGSTGNVQVGAGLRPGSGDTNKTLYRTFWLYWAILSLQRKNL